MSGSVTDPRPPDQYCRSCATRVPVTAAGVLISHTPGGGRASRPHSRPHCLGSSRPGWIEEFPRTTSTAAAAEGWLTITELRARFALDPLQVRLLHLRDLFPRPVAILPTPDWGNQYLYDPATLSASLPPTAATA